MELIQDYIPVKDFAKIEGVTVQAIYERIRRGTLKSKKIGTYTLVKKV